MRCGKHFIWICPVTNAKPVDGFHDILRVDPDYANVLNAIMDPFRDKKIQSWTKSALRMENNLESCRHFGLTSELSRPGTGRRLVANIAEGVHLDATLMWAWLE